MSIKYAILGYLSWTPLSGYDLKKLFEESATLHWSGNNNQIYKALVDLHTQGMVSQHTEQQGDYPPRKVYTITGEGRSALREWVASPPEIPQTRNPFLAQLAWADLLEPNELDGLLNAYEDEINVQLLMLREHSRRERAAPDRSAREIVLWDAIMENRILACETEITWVRGLRKKMHQIYTGEQK